MARRPKRADARRNHDALLDAARDVFAQHGANASLEEIARRANVGIATLYRNFPTRRELLEAVYVHEVQALVASCPRPRGRAGVGCARDVAAALRGVHRNQASDPGGAGWRFTSVRDMLRCDRRAPASRC